MTFFDNYKDALRKGRELLFAAGDPGENRGWRVRAWRWMAGLSRRFTCITACWRDCRRSSGSIADARMPIAAI